jgi:phosphohistidine phosphatase
MLTLYLIRHAEAVPTGDPNYEDDDRPLTPAGRATARSLGSVLATKGIKFNVVLTSPLPRAKQTAEELLAGYGEGAAELVEVDELAPGVKPRKLDKRLLKTEGDAIALVGHQPDLGDYAGRLIGAKEARMKLAKPSVVCIECDEPPDKEAGELQWLLAPPWFSPANAPAEDPGPVLYADGAR